MADLEKSYAEITNLLKRRIVGMEDVIRLLLAGIFSGGHCLLVGVPGLAKTRLIASLAQLLELEFSRIQFTPDLMPSDITGAEIIVEDKQTGDREFKFLRGPLFANVVLADEINRTPPKTQAALMEAMEERQVSSLGQRFELDAPFFVLATQNPIEQEGTYPLPAAQLDRFVFEIKVDYPSEREEADIIKMTTRPHEGDLKPVLSRSDVLEIIAQVRAMRAPDDVTEYATRVCRLTRPDDADAPAVAKKYFAYGAGPRAAQSLVLASKVLALMRGDGRPTCADVRELVLPVLRHRVVINFLGAADGVDVDELLREFVGAVPAPDRPHGVPSRKKKGFLASLFARS